MNKADCFNLGYVAKLHGYKGEVSFFLDTTDPQKYSNLDFVYIDLNGILTPFFIERLELHKKKNFAKVKLEGVNTESEAKNLLQKELFLSIENLPQLTGNNFYDHEVVDFIVYDQEYGKVGKIIQIIDNKVNPLLQIWNEDLKKEVLLPLINDLIQSVNREKKELQVKAIPGLIELYLEEISK